MPNPYWSHPCCEDTDTLRPVKACPSCGRPGTYQGWRPTVHEAMTAYERRYGLKPVGPHHELANRLLGELQSTCPRCDGVGIVESDTVFGYSECRHCEGGGGAWTGSDEQIREAYRRILRQYPDAAGEKYPTPTIWVPSPPLRPTRKRTRRRKRRRRRKTNKAQLTDVQRAFVEAERRLGTKWKVKGRGHCRRATLKSGYATSVHRVTSCWETLTPHSASNPLGLYPLAIILEAAGILGIEMSELMGTEY